MLSLSLCVLGALACASPGGSSGQPGHISVSDLESGIKSRGATVALRELWEDRSEWQWVLKQVSTARTGWIRVAGTLLAVADGGASEDLSISLAEALSRSPTETLAAIAQATAVEATCGNEESLGDDYDTAMSVIDRRLKAVSNVKDCGFREFLPHDSGNSCRLC